MRKNAALVVPAALLGLTALLFAARSAPAAPKAYKVVEVKDGGTIRGTCRIQEVPVLDKVKSEKDNDKGCGEKERDTERVITGEDRGLANCLVFIKSIDEGKDWPEAMRSEDRKGVIDQKGCRYGPHVQWVRMATQMSVSNSDGADHNIHAYRGSMADTQFNFSSAPGKTVDDLDQEFLEKAGKYLVKCDIHPWMSAFVHVVTHPYHDVSANPGTPGRKCGEYVLEDVPPGSYTLVFWHEGMIETAVKQDGQIKAYTYSEDLPLEEEAVTVEAGKTTTMDHEFKMQSK